ncbi:MAG TPA: diguanylate cyclase [Acidobacteriaceae bacterium]|nr:diguanylate cyclase [Acidobacteriaceae bacterium]
MRDLLEQKLASPPRPLAGDDPAPASPPGAIEKIGNSVVAATTNDRVLKPVAQFFAAGISSWLVMVWLNGLHSFLYVWPLTGISLALILGSWDPGPQRYLHVVCSSCGQAIAYCMVGLAPVTAGTLALTQGLEVWVCAAVLSPWVTSFDDLKQRANVLRLGIVALAAPVLFMAIAALPFAAITHTHFLFAWRMLVPADCLGIGIVVPSLLFPTSGEFRSLNKLRPHLTRSTPALVFFFAAVGVIFLQSSEPFLFLVFPPLVLVIFSMGLEGAAIALPSITIMACTTLAYRWGPLWVDHEPAASDRIFLMQVFLATVVAVALAVGALLDERRRAERSAEENQSIFQTLIQNSEDMIVLSTLGGQQRFVSPAVAKITGWSPRDFVQMEYLHTMHPDDRELGSAVLANLAAGKLNQTFRYRARCKDGEHRWVEASLRGYRHADSVDVAGYVSTIRDISLQKQAEDTLLAERAVLSQEKEQLAGLASLDELTQIPNRRAFNNALQQEALRHTRLGKPLALLMLDVDFFKLYNDRYGHQEGDKCLQALAQTMQACIGRVSDMVARIGGEEFSILLPGTDEAGAVKVALDILSRVRRLNIKHADSPFGRVSVSIGIAAWPSKFSTDISFLMQQADRALYETKHNGRNNFTVQADDPNVMATGKYWDIE